jgi:hypothetical protein
LSASTIGAAVSAGNYLRDKKTIAALVAHDFDHGAVIWLADSVDFKTIKVLPFKDITGQVANPAHPLSSITYDELDNLASKVLERVILLKTLPSYVLVSKGACGGSISFDEKWESYVLDSEGDTNDMTRKVSNYEQSILQELIHLVCTI